MDHLSTVIVVANTITLLVGSFVVVRTYLAYRRTESRALRALALGLALVTAGTLLGGALHQLGGVDLLTSVAVTSVATAVGFLALAYSLYAEHTMTGSVRARRS